MSEIIGYLSSPSWWFATVFVAFVVNVASGLFVDALRNRTIHRLSETAVHYALFTHGCITVFSSILTALGSVDAQLHGLTLFLGASSFFFIVRFLSFPPRSTQWGLWLLGLAATNLIVISLVAPIAGTYTHYSYWAPPFVVYFVASVTSLCLMQAVWHTMNLRKLMKG
jgi:hypothetical protein